MNIYGANIMKEKFLGEVYLVTCIITGKQYVGITTRGYLNRWKRHIRASLKKKDNYKFHAAIRKYGVENFIIEVLERKSYSNPKRLVGWLYRREMFWIEKLETKRYGYNSTDGGDGVLGLARTDEERKLMSDRMKLWYHEHPEMKQFVVQKAHEKLLTSQYRKINSERQKARFSNPAERLRISRLTKQGMSKLSTETKERIKETQFKKGQKKTWNKGLETPDEVKKKISDSCKGRAAWNKGVSMSEEQKKKVSENRKGIPAWNKGKKVERKETCPICGKLICWNMLNRHIKARHS